MTNYTAIENFRAVIIAMGSALESPDLRRVVSFEKLKQEMLPVMLEIALNDRRDAHYWWEETVELFDDFNRELAQVNAPVLEIPSYDRFEELLEDRRVGTVDVPAAEAADAPTFLPKDIFEALLSDDLHHHAKVSCVITRYNKRYEGKRRMLLCFAPLQPEPGTGAVVLLDRAALLASKLSGFESQIFNILVDELSLRAGWIFEQNSAPAWNRLFVDKITAILIEEAA